MSCTAIAKCTWLIRRLQRLLRHAEHRAEVGRFLHQREVVGRQRLQREAALAALQRELVLVARCSVTIWSAGSERRMSISLRAPTVVAKLPASPPSSAVVRTWISRSLVVNSICAAGLAHQHVGQDRQGVPALDDAGHRLQRAQELFPVLPSRQSCEPLNLVVVVEDDRFLWTTPFSPVPIKRLACRRTLWAERLGCGAVDRQQLRRAARACG